MLANTTNMIPQEMEEEEENDLSHPRLVSMMQFAKSPIRWVCYVGHTACAVGLFTGYHAVCVAGDGIWHRFMRLRRGFLATGITLGILSVITLGKEWENEMKMHDASNRFPLLWVPRALHVLIGPLTALFVEYYGPDYAKYAVIAMATNMFTAKISQIFQTFYTQSLLAQVVKENIFLRVKLRRNSSNSQTQQKLENPIVT